MTSNDKFGNLPALETLPAKELGNKFRREYEDIVANLLPSERRETTFVLSEVHDDLQALARKVSKAINALQGEGE